MVSEFWFQRVASSVPRGFSRYFILELLRKKPHDGKEIREYAIEQSNGIWSPSTGLIYPVLNRLVDEELIEKGKHSRFHLTKKGKEAAGDVDMVNGIISRQLEVLVRLGSIGRFVAIDLLEKISSMSFYSKYRVYLYG